MPQIDFRAAREAAERTAAGADDNPSAARAWAVYSDLWVEYQASALVHRRAALWWNFAASTLILLVVLGLVVFGAVMAYLQFAAGMAVGEATKLTFSREKLEVSSTIIGVIILLISFVFFYVSLDKVYDLHEIGLKQKSQTM